jgi:hypothetical protein
MSNPIIQCSTCKRSRDCMLHTRAEFPPDAAERWLRKSCQTRSACNFIYKAGVKPFPVVTGQNP